MRQKVNALNLSTTENKLKTLTFLKLLKTSTKSETYFDLIEYIRQYISFYRSIFRSLQNLKTTLLKAKFANSVDVKKSLYFENEVAIDDERE